MIVQTVFPEELVRKVDEFTEKLKEAYPGLNISRSSTVKMLVEQALKNAEKEGAEYL